MSKLNIQQLPKEKNFLKCFIAKPGHKLIYTDINSLEPHVLAHFSKDPGLMSLYGPNARPNDVYLFVGSKINKWKDDILKYYDPDNPTPEGIAAAKKYAKSARQAVKAPYLGWMYGLGPYTMSQGTGIPEEECRDILSDIDDTFPGVVRFNDSLKYEWKFNGGWVKQEWKEDPKTGRRFAEFINGKSGWFLNGRLRPMGVAPNKLKDIGNRFVQSTGHDVLMQLLWIINNNRSGLDMKPYNVDVHDATVWQVKEDQAEAAAQVLKVAYDQLNTELNWDVVIKGDILIGDNLGDFLE